MWKQIKANVTHAPQKDHKIKHFQRNLPWQSSTPLPWTKYEHKVLSHPPPHISGGRVYFPSPELALELWRTLLTEWCGGAILCQVLNYLSVQGGGSSCFLLAAISRSRDQPGGETTKRERSPRLPTILPRRQTGERGGPLEYSPQLPSDCSFIWD